MAPIINPLSEAEGSIELEGITISFTEASEISWKWNETKHADGTAGGKMRSKRVGGKEYSNITLKKPYVPGEDSALVDWCGDPCAEAKTVDYVLVDGCPDRVRETWTLIDCMPVNFKGPSINQEGSGVVMLEVELTFNEAQRR
jgi:phage tail-like protein